MSCVHECNVTFLLEVTWDRGNDSFEVLHRCLLVVQIFSGYPFCCQGSYWIPFENENDENENENDENENENENEEKKRKYTLIQLLKMMADVNSARGVVRDTSLLLNSSEVATIIYLLSLDSISFATLEAF